MRKTPRPLTIVAASRKEAKLQRESHGNLHRKEEVARERDPIEEGEKLISDSPWLARMIFIFVMRVLDIIQSAVQGKYLAIIGGLFIAGMVTLELASPSGGGAESLQKAGELAIFAVSSRLLCWLGWIFLAIYVPASFVYMYIQHKRIVAQGEENAKLRTHVDPARISSKNPPGGDE